MCGTHPPGVHGAKGQAMRAPLELKPRDIGGTVTNDGWTAPIELSGGYSVRVQVEYDNDMGPPWEEHDGHGPVSEWTTRDKAPGERVLCVDRSQKRYYDFAAAVKLARKDGWGADGDAGMKPGAKAAHAANADYEFLRRWANDQWHWICVGVEVSRAGAVIDRDYCGGIEDDGDYWREHASDTANAIIAADRRARKAASIAARKETRERRYWESRDMVTQ